MNQQQLLDSIEKIKKLEIQIEELKNQFKTQIEKSIKVIEIQIKEIKNSINQKKL